LHSPAPLLIAFAESLTELGRAVAEGE
jgi:hypothetical protein